MRGIATVFAVLLKNFVALALSIWPLFSTPENPVYLRYVPELISQAREEVLLALSDLRAYADGATDALLSSLCRAAEKGAAVYVLLEKSTRPLLPEQEAAWTRLQACGAKMRTDAEDVTLHAKFAVLDRRIVVVGSTHWTKSALTGSVQVDVILEDERLAETFRAFFFYLWEGKLRTKTRLPQDPWPEPAVIPLLDFPETNGHFQAALRLLETAEAEILLLLYQFAYYPQYPDSPSTRLFQALTEASKRGVKVQALLEGGENDPSLSETNRFTSALLSTYGLAARLDRLGTTMHAKCLIVDRRHVLISSANWNYSSLAKNVEAGVLILGVPELAQTLSAYFAELWEKSVPLR